MDKNTEKMQLAFNKVKDYTNKDISPEDKIEAWKYFNESFQEDNPYSDEDDKMRKKADEQIAMAKRSKGGAALDGMVFVKGGCYQMGDAFGDGGVDEKPVHEVCVDDFYIGKYEATQKQWHEIMGNNPSNFKGCDNCPVEQVSWNDAQEYINKLNQNTGKKYRLPTEANGNMWLGAAGRTINMQEAMILTILRGIPAIQEAKPIR